METAVSFKLRDLWGEVEPVIREKHSEKMPTPVHCGSESKVQHHFQDACDINRIAGTPQTADPSMVFRDLSDIMDFGKNMDKAAKAQQLFDQTPVALRKRVGHSIQGLFEFIGDESNFDECVKFGIFNPRPEPAAGAGVGAGMPAPQSKKDGSLKAPKKSSEPETED